MYNLLQILCINFQTQFAECVHPVSFSFLPPPALQCACNCSGLSSEVRKLARFTLLSNKNYIYSAFNSTEQYGVVRHDADYCTIYDNINNKFSHQLLTANIFKLYITSLEHQIMTQKQKILLLITNYWVQRM